MLSIVAADVSGYRVTRFRAANLALVIFAERWIARIGWAIAIVTATASHAIDAYIVVGAASSIVAGSGAVATLACGAITAIGAIGEVLIDAAVVLTGDQIAGIGRAISVDTRAAIWVETAIAAGAAEQPIRTAGTARIVWEDLLCRTTLFFGDADGASRATCIVAALFGRLVAIGTEIKSRWTAASSTVPDLRSRTGNRFGRWGGTASGLGAGGVVERGRATQTEQSLQNRTAAAAARERFCESVERCFVATI